MDLNSMLSYFVTAARLFLPALVNGPTTEHIEPVQTSQDVSIEEIEQEEPESNERVTYSNAQVWRTPLRSQADVEMFEEFADDGDVSMWKLTRNQADYMVTNENRLRVHRQLRKKRLNHTVLIMDVQRRIDATNIQPSLWTNSSLRKGYRLNFQSYPNLEVIDEYIEHIRINYPSIVSVSTIGRSVEDRNIKMIHITNGNPKNKIMLLVGGHHAREWVGISSALYIINNLVTKYDEQPNYMKNKDWYIIPLLNPDGYHFSLTSDRLWRKNRRVIHLRSCYGVDLNRNYPKNWDIKRLNVRDQCRSDYSGPYALSEPEVQALVDVIDSMRKTPSAFVDFHSYGQLLIYPWGTGAISPHEKILKSTAQNMKAAIQKVSGRSYSYGTALQLLYAVSGAALDYAHAKGIQLVYAIECRDSMNGPYGFLLPSSEIEDTGKEMLAALRDLAKTLDPTIMRSKTQRWF